MQKEAINELGEILNEFEPEDFGVLIKEQINKSSSDIEYPIDHYKPLYVKYRQILEKDMNVELRAEVEKRFIDFCCKIIECIEESYDLDIDEEWMDSHIRDIPAITLILYSFFVLELLTNIEDAVRRFIFLNTDSLYEMFEERKGKHDAATMLYRDKLTPERSLLMANIYDVSTHVIETISEAEFLEYLPDGYVPRDVIRKMYDSGDLNGDFMNQIRNMFSNNISLKSRICFDIESEFRKDYNINDESPFKADNKSEKKK